MSLSKRLFLISSLILCSRSSALAQTATSTTSPVTDATISAIADAYSTATGVCSSIGQATANCAVQGATLLLCDFDRNGTIDTVSEAACVMNITAYIVYLTSPTPYFPPISGSITNPPAQVQPSAPVPTQGTQLPPATPLPTPTGQFSPVGVSITTMP